MASKTRAMSCRHFIAHARIRHVIVIPLLYSLLCGFLLLFLTSHWCILFVFIRCSDWSIYLLVLPCYSEAKPNLSGCTGAAR